MEQISSSLVRRMRFMRPLIEETSYDSSRRAAIMRNDDMYDAVRAANTIEDLAPIAAEWLLLWALLDDADTSELYATFHVIWPDIPVHRAFNRWLRIKRAFTIMPSLDATCGNWISVLHEGLFAFALCPDHQLWRKAVELAPTAWLRMERAVEVAVDMGTWGVDEGEHLCLSLWCRLVGDVALWPPLRRRIQQEEDTGNEENEENEEDALVEAARPEPASDERPSLIDACPTTPTSIVDSRRSLDWRL